MVERIRSGSWCQHSSGVFAVQAVRLEYPSLPFTIPMIFIAPTQAADVTVPLVRAAPRPQPQAARQL